MISWRNPCYEFRHFKNVFSSVCFCRGGKVQSFRPNGLILDKIIMKIPCVQEVVTPFYIVSYYINGVTTSWTHGISLSRYIHTINRYIQILNIMERGKFEHGEGHLGRKLHPCPLYSCRWWDNPYVPVMTISFSARCVVNNQHLDNRTNIYEQTSVQSKPYTVNCKRCSLNYSIHYIYYRTPTKKIPLGVSHITANLYCICENACFMFA